jgi:hypothetical protein
MSSRYKHIQVPKLPLDPARNVYNLERYPSGKRKEWFYRDLVTTYEERVVWYENGKRWCEGRYYNDADHGRHLTWFPDGKTQYDYHYDHGRIHGRQREWFQNGQIAECSNYQRSERHGRYRLWGVNGYLYRDEHYVFGINSEDARVVLCTLRRALWKRRFRLLKFRSVIEWWYQPENSGGLISKLQIESMISSLPQK